jgi:hypothetical protein
MRKLMLVAFLMAPLLAIGATPAAACGCCPCGYSAPTIVYTYHCGPYYGPPRACLGGYFARAPVWGWRAFSNGNGWRGYRWGSRGYGYRSATWRGHRMGWRGGRHR